MTKQPLQKPTASELEILRVLWERGPSTVRDVHEALREKKDLGYTTVLKLLQIMTAKGTVRRNEEQRAHVYEACQPATETKRQLVGDVLQRVFEGSSESGRADWGGRSYDVGGNVHPKRDRAVGLPSPSCWISDRTTDGDVVAGGSVVSGSSFAEPENRGRIDADRTNASQRDQSGGGGAIRKVPGAATQNGPRPRDPG